MEEKNIKKKNNKQYFSQSDKIEIKRKIDEVKTSTVPMVAVLNNVLNEESRKLDEEESLPTRILENNNSSWNFINCLRNYLSWIFCFRSSNANHLNPDKAKRHHLK